MISTLENEKEDDRIVEELGFACDFQGGLNFTKDSQRNVKVRIHREGGILIKTWGSKRTGYMSQEKSFMQKEQQTWRPWSGSGPDSFREGKVASVRPGEDRGWARPRGFVPWVSTSHWNLTIPLPATTLVFLQMGFTGSWGLIIII